MKMAHLFSKLGVFITTDEKNNIERISSFLKKNKYMYMYMKTNTTVLDYIVQVYFFFSYHMTMCNCPLIYSLESPIIRLLFPNMLSGSM